MRLLRFEATGFKNFVEPVVLDRLDSFVVIHGDNNIGKSNLLKAVDLFFTTLRGAGAGKNPFGSILQPPGPDGFFMTFGQGAAEVFELGRHSPPPVWLRGTIETSDDEMAAAGLRERLPQRVFDIDVELARVSEHRATGRMLRIAEGNGGDSLPTRDYEEEQAELLALLRLLATMSLSLAPHNSRFIRIRSKRTDQKSQEELAAKLYEARDSTNLEVARRWERFEEAMRGFGDLLGPGRFVPIRPEGPALLTFQNDRARIPLHLLGSGVQQVVSVIGELLCGGASIAAIEEPEVHLKTAIQERLREMLRGLPGKPGAPSQIFITSHSPSFELADAFHHIERSPAGHPMVTRRSRDEAAVVLGASSGAITSTGAAVSWVSSDGVVRLPPRVRTHIGREHGGDIVFSLADDKTAELRASDTFLAKHGLDEPEGES